LHKLDLDHKIIETNNNGEETGIKRLKIVIPDIIILDLNMPKINSTQCLQILKDRRLSKIHSSDYLLTSNNHKDVLEC
jgi:CheY-like chemotaxis protein